MTAAAGCAQTSNAYGVPAACVTGNPSITVLSSNTSTRFLVIVTAFVQASVASTSGYVSVSIDSATPSDTMALVGGISGGGGGPTEIQQASTVTYLTLTAGQQHTLALQYRVNTNGNTATFSNRAITLIPLNWERAPVRLHRAEPRHRRNPLAFFAGRG